MESISNNLDSFGQTVEALSVTEIREPFDFVSRLYINDERLAPIPGLDHFLDFRFEENWACPAVLHANPEDLKDLKKEIKHTKELFQRKLRHINAHHNEEQSSEIMHYGGLEDEEEPITKPHRAAENGFATFNDDGSLTHYGRLNNQSEDSIDYSFAEAAENDDDLPQLEAVCMNDLPSWDYTERSEYWQEVAARCAEDYENQETAALDFRDLPDVYSNIEKIYINTKAREVLRRLLIAISNKQPNFAIEPCFMFRHVCLENGPVEPCRPEFGILDFRFPVTLLYQYNTLFEEVQRCESASSLILSRNYENGWIFGIIQEESDNNAISPICPICTRWQLLSAAEFKEQAPFGVPSRELPYGSWVLLVESQAISFTTDEETLGRLAATLRLAYGEVVGVFDHLHAGSLDERRIYANRYKSCEFMRDLVGSESVLLCNNTNNTFENVKSGLAEQDPLITERLMARLFFRAIVSERPVERRVLRQIVDFVQQCPEKLEIIAGFIFKYPILNDYSLLETVQAGRAWARRITALRESVRLRRQELRSSDIEPFLDALDAQGDIPTNMPELGCFSVCYRSDQLTETFSIKKTQQCSVDFGSLEFECFLRLLPGLFECMCESSREYRDVLDLFRYQFTGKEVQTAFCYAEESHTAVIWVFDSEDDWHLSEYEQMYGTLSCVMRPLPATQPQGSILIVTHIGFSDHKLCALVDTETGLPFMLSYQDKIPLTEAETELGISLQNAEAYINILQIGEQKISVALSEKMVEVQGYSEVELDHLSIDMGLIFGREATAELHEAFSEYLQLCAQTDLPINALGNFPEQPFELPVDSDSESSFRIDEFDTIKDVQDAIMYHYDHVQESVQLQSYLSSLVAAAVKFDPLNCVWRKKCSGRYNQREIVSNSADEQQIDELEHLGLFFNNYESQFGTPLTISENNMEFLLCKPDCPVERARIPYKRGYAFASGWGQMMRK